MPILFDNEYYLSQNPDIAAAGLDGWTHFLAAGAREKRSPHPLFDLYEYSTQFDDLEKILPNPIEHYLNGGYRIANPHPIFDREFYLASGNALPEDTNPLLHFMEFGAAEDRDPHPLFRTAHYRKTAGLDQSDNPLIHFILNRAKEGHDPHPLFSIAYYFKHNPDVKAKGRNPIVHYLRSKPSEFRRPHALFDPYYYHETYAITLDADLLSHYIKKGAKSAFNPHQLFDATYYEDQNKDVDWSRNNPLEHFLQVGAAKGKSPHPLFDIDFYNSQRSDIPRGIENPLAHYIEVGAFEGLDPHPLFHSKYYAERHKYDARAKGLSPLEHYLKYGSDEGRNPNGFFDDRFYLECNGATIASKKNPLTHYVLNGAASNLDPHPHFNVARYVRLFEDDEAAKANPLKHFFEWCRSNDLSPTGRQVTLFLQETSRGDRSTNRFHKDYLQERRKEIGLLGESKAIVALYQPQLRSPENLGAPDYWLDVVQKSDKVRGLPSDLGFYDLRNESIVKEQHLLACKYGVDAFCIVLPLHFVDKLVLPLDQFGKMADEAPPHCICVTIDDSVDFDIEAVTSRVAKYLEHPKYLTTEGEKLLFIRAERKENLEKLGTDFLNYFKPSDNFKTRVIAMPVEQVHLSRSPGKYQAFLEKALQSGSNQDGLSKIVVVDSWNDWLSDSQLEPDISFGHAFLESTKNAIDAVQSAQSGTARSDTEEKLGRRYFGLPESSYVYLVICDLANPSHQSALAKSIEAFSDAIKEAPQSDLRLAVHLINTSGNASAYRAALLSLSNLSELAVILDDSLTDNELNNLIRNSDYLFPPL